MRISRYIILLVLALGWQSISAQGIAIGQWRDHYPYKKGISVAEGGDIVYCMSLGGLFSYNKNDNSIERLSKVSGLSDVEFSAIGFNKYNNTLVIAYKNGNVDFITSEKKIINIADIKRANIIGNKTINNIFFQGKYAYLACGFGIVVLDTDKQEVKDTYYIGPAGGNVNVMEVTTDAVNIYAAAMNGVYYAPLSANLSNYASWSKFTGLPNGPYNTITSFNGKVFVNYSKALSSAPVSGQDTIYIYDSSASSWTLFPAPFNYTVTHLRSMNNKLLVTTQGYVAVYDQALGTPELMYTYTFGVPAPNDAVMDATNKLWIADRSWGLVGGINPWSNSSYVPNGPSASLGPVITGAYRMSSATGAVAFVAGNVTETWNNSYLFGEFSKFSEETWNSADGSRYPRFLDSLLDFVSVAIDPLNPQTTYVGTWGKGLLEFNNTDLVKIHNSANSNGALSPENVTFDNVKIGGLSFDSENNLWMTNSFAYNSKGIAVKKANGTWASYNLAPAMAPGTTLGSIVANKVNQKWVVLPRGGGLLVFDETRTPGSWAKKLSTSTGNGGLPSNEVICIAEDKDGEMWVGTDKGIAVFYSPELVFNSSGFDAQQIIIEQDGHYQILLETELITDIKVDGANRKWIATQNAGVFLMSEDGTTQIYHFDMSNSPLPSNEVSCLAIEPISGEVFFGTPKGVVSFKGTATEGAEEYDGVYAYPNPVNPGYEGMIAIRGLVTDAEVRITDISGTLVYSTKAEGGQAVWNGKTIKGERVSSGVYMVFCSNEDGSKTFVTKIVVVN
jgi:hypothetical protein